MSVCLSVHAHVTTRCSRRWHTLPQVPPPGELDQTTLCDVRLVPLMTSSFSHNGASGAESKTTLCLVESPGVMLAVYDCLVVRSWASVCVWVPFSALTLLLEWHKGHPWKLVPIIQKSSVFEVHGPTCRKEDRINKNCMWVYELDGMCNVDTIRYDMI